MYFQAPHRDADATHIFPRGKDGMGGVILGGCRQKNNWDGEVDLEFAEVIKRKCCALVPQLGKPENLKIIKHGVGLRRTYHVFLTHHRNSQMLIVYSQPNRGCSG